MVGLDMRDHFRELLSHDGLLDEWFPEDDALVAPFQALFHDGAHLADYGAGHHEALVVEVGHCLDMSANASKPPWYGYEK